MTKSPGKVAVVTGAVSGIGLAATKLFSSKRASVLAIDVDAKALEAAAGELGSSVTAFAADVADEAQMAQAMAKAAELHSGIDIVVGNAGIFGVQKPIVEAPSTASSGSCTSTSLGCWSPSRPGRRTSPTGEGGSIIITSSVGGLHRQC